MVTNDDRAGTEHRSGFGKSLKIETNVDHRRGKVSGRWTRWREGLELTTAANATGVIENDLAHRHAHGDLENPWAPHLATHPAKFQPARAPVSPSHKPINPTKEDFVY